MTVLDRLSKKGRVTRELEGRAWIYSPAESRATLMAAEMLAALTGTSEQRTEALREFAAALTAEDAQVMLGVLRTHEPAA
jgi:predicted transcriptional regulator